MSNKPTPRPKTIRCAIYTRKSTEEGPDGQVSHRIADIQERIEKAELELAKVNRQLVDLEKHEMSTQEIEDALIDFDRIWDALTTREQSQLLALLVSNLTVSRQSHFEAKKARFGPKSLDSLIAKNLGYDQGL